MTRERARRVIGADIDDVTIAMRLKGLGMRLIRSVLGQFGGTITLSSGPGAIFVVDMPRSSSMPRNATPRPIRITGTTSASISVPMMASTFSMPKYS